jgi:hypothetical protein
MKLHAKPAINVVFLAIPIDLNKTARFESRDGPGKFHVILKFGTGDTGVPRERILQACQ